MQNFGKIKNVFNNLFVESLGKKDASGKKLFKKYMKTIKESEILKTQFLIYSNIETRVDEDIMSANLFISENIKLLEKYSKKDILKENNKLISFLDKSKNKLDISYIGEDLHESLSNLIFINRTPKNISKITEEIKNVSKYISTNKEKEINTSIELPVSFLTNLMVEKYNEKYDTLDEFDKNVLRVLMSPDLEKQKVMHCEIVNECIGLVEGLIENANGEYKEKLLKVKAKLDEKEDINKENLIEKISKLVELKNNLKG